MKVDSANSRGARRPWSRPQRFAAALAALFCVSSCAAQARAQVRVLTGGACPEAAGAFAEIEPPPGSPPATLDFQQTAGGIELTLGTEGSSRVLVAESCPAAISAAKVILRLSGEAQTGDAPPDAASRDPEQAPDEVPGAQATGPTLDARNTSANGSRTGWRLSVGSGISWGVVDAAWPPVAVTLAWTGGPGARLRLAASARYLAPTTTEYPATQGSLRTRALGGAAQACGLPTHWFYACAVLRADAIRGDTVGGLASSPATLPRIGAGAALGLIADFDSGFFLAAEFESTATLSGVRFSVVGAPEAFTSPSAAVEVNAQLGWHFF